MDLLKTILSPKSSPSNFFCQGQMRTFTIPIHHRESLHSFIHQQQKLEAQTNKQFTGTKEDEILDQKIR